MARGNHASGGRGGGGGGNSNAMDLPGDRGPRKVKALPILWKDFDSSEFQSFTEELHPIQEVLNDCLTTDEKNQLLTYCLLWHPRCPPTLKQEYRKVIESPYSRFPISQASIARLISDAASSLELLKLIGDRGPDFAFSLLVLLEVLFQAAFCMRKPPAQPSTVTSAAGKLHGGVDEDAENLPRRQMAAVIGFSPRLLETIGLHLDSPPLWPTQRLKYGLTLMGLIYHRKLPNPALSRFYQLQYFLTPHSRRLFLRGATDSHDTSRVGYFGQEVEAALWRLAANLSLGRPTQEKLTGIMKRERPQKIEMRMDAMVVVFERLNHLSRSLFGTSLCLYGSASTGFATTASDVDVVLKLTDAGVQKMLAEANEWRHRPDGIDLNCFPARTQQGFAQMVGNWEWLDSKDPRVSAAIWAGRKFAWSCHRLLGWDVQCVQGAYVPIVRIVACVNASGGNACEVPPVFRQAVPADCSLAATLWKLWPCKPFLQAAGCLADASSTILCTLCGYRPYEKDRWESSIAKLVALDVVAERQYAAWEPSFTPRVDEKAAALLLKGGGEPTEIKEAEKLHMKLFYEFLNDDLTLLSASPSTPPTDEEVQTDEDGAPAVSMLGAANDENDPPVLSVSLSRRSPALMHPKPSTEIDDGRLSPIVISHYPRDIYLVESDFSIGRQVGIHNSRLLRAYASCDPRVLALGLLVKHWAKCFGIDDAYAGFFSGYQWTLLVIHFLQHYLCLPAPESVTRLNVWRNLATAYRHAQYQFTKRLPLVPNLQNDPPAHTGVKKAPLLIEEVEGEVDVFFYQPDVGTNSLINEQAFHQPAGPSGGTSNAQHQSGSSGSSGAGGAGQHLWPEDTLLGKNPFYYGYDLLAAPFDLSVYAKHWETSANPLETAEAVYESHRSKEATKILYEMRVMSTPRPFSEAFSGANAPEDGGSTPANSHHLQQQQQIAAYDLWDRQRHVISERMIREALNPDNQATTLKYCGVHGGLRGLCGCPVDQNSYVTDRESFPELSRCRDHQFFADHIIDRESLILLDMKQAGNSSPTLSELLCAFFEYYTFRFNYATDVADIDRCPGLPAGKKEIFKTSLFNLVPSAAPKSSPMICVSSVMAPTFGCTEADAHEQEDDVAHQTADEPVEAATTAAPAKEVAGRGLGPFQYRGRHFLCLRDPFEKARTIGPPYRAQSRISAVFLKAILLLNDRPESCIQYVFEPRRQNLSSSCSVFHPIRESMATYLNMYRRRAGNPNPQQLRVSSSLSAQENAEVYEMYVGLVDLVLKYGNYKQILDDFNPHGALQRVRGADIPRTAPPAAVLITEEEAERLKAQKAMVARAVAETSRPSNPNPPPPPPPPPQSVVHQRQPASEARTKQTDQADEGYSQLIDDPVLCSLVFVNPKMFKSQVRGGGGTSGKNGSPWRMTKDVETEIQWLEEHTGMPLGGHGLPNEAQDVGSGTASAAEVPWDDADNLLRNVRAHLAVFAKSLPADPQHEASTGISFYNPLRTRAASPQQQPAPQPARSHSPSEIIPHPPSAPAGPGPRSRQAGGWTAAEVIAYGPGLPSEGHVVDSRNRRRKGRGAGMNGKAAHGVGPIPPQASSCNGNAGRQLLELIQNGSSGASQAALGSQPMQGVPSVVASLSPQIVVGGVETPVPGSAGPQVVEVSRRRRRAGDQGNGSSRRNKGSRASTGGRGK